VTRYTYDGAHRLPTISDARGITFIQNVYDAAGRVVRQLFPD
jgi:RHS repeat protein